VTARNNTGRASAKAQRRAVREKRLGYGSSQKEEERIEKRRGA